MGERRSFRKTLFGILVGILLFSCKEVPAGGGGIGGVGGATEITQLLNVAEQTMARVSAELSYAQQGLDYALQMKKYIAVLQGLKDVPPARLAMMLTGRYNEFAAREEQWKQTLSRGQELGRYATKIDDIARDFGKGQQARDKYRGFNDALLGLDREIGKGQKEILAKAAERDRALEVQKKLNDTELQAANEEPTKIAKLTAARQALTAEQEANAQATQRELAQLKAEEDVARKEMEAKIHEVIMADQQKLREQASAAANVKGGDLLSSSSRSAAVSAANAFGAKR